jgi:uncharacterized protein YbaP (TraB family)
MLVRRAIALWLLLVLAAPAAAAPAMWVVKDADTEITLFGTVHALKKADDWLSPAIAARLDAADTLVLEAVVPADKLALGSIIAEIGLREGQKPVVARVSKELAPKVAPLAAKAGVPLLALDRMDSWLAAITLGEASLAAIGISAESGVEPALEARARAANKPVIGLETIEQQLRFFDALPEADQVAMLEATLSDAGSAREETDRLIALWKAGDVDAIARDFAREARASPLLTKVLLTDRNNRWADWIAGVMRRPGHVFIGVGAAHLGGDDGLIAALAKRGLVAEPFK